MTKEQTIQRIIKIAYDSLQSHFEWTYKASSEGKAFHRTCVRDYTEQIYLTAKQL